MVLVGDGQLRNSNRNPPHHWKSLANKHKPVIFGNVRKLSRFFRLSFSFFKVCVLIWFVENFIFFLINILNNISMRMFTKMFSSRFFKIYMYVSSHISLTQMLMKGERCSLKKHITQRQAGVAVLYYMHLHMLLKSMHISLKLLN